MSLFANRIGTAVVSYAPLAGARRIVVTMRGYNRRPPPHELLALTTTLFPDMPVQAALGQHPLTLCLVESDSVETDTAALTNLFGDMKGVTWVDT